MAKPEMCLADTVCPVTPIHDEITEHADSVISAETFRKDVLASLTSAWRAGFDQACDAILEMQSLEAVTKIIHPRDLRMLAALVRRTRP